MYFKTLFWEGICKLYKTFRVVAGPHKQRWILCEYLLEENNNNTDWKRISASPSSLQHLAIIYNSQDRGTTKVSTEQIKSNWCVDLHTQIQTQTGILFSHKKEGTLVICDSKDRPWAHYAETSQRGLCCLIPHMNVESNKVKLVKSESKTGGYQEMGMGE